MSGLKLQTSRLVLLNTMLLLLLLGSLFFCSWVNNKAVIKGYELSRLRTEEKNLLEQQDKLQAELATLLRPQNLARLALELGLKEPQPGQKVVLP